jgi:formate hydrogenlyase subunit 4
MVLDFSSADLALVLYAGAVKLLVFATLLAHVALMIAGMHSATALIAATILIALLIAATESLTARIRLLRIPHMLGMATAIAVLALLLTLA